MTEIEAIYRVAMGARYQERIDEHSAYRNAFSSPHIAASTVDSYQETVRACVENIRATHQNSTTQGLIRSAD